MPQTGTGGLMVKQHAEWHREYVSPGFAVLSFPAFHDCLAGMASIDAMSAAAPNASRPAVTNS